MTNHTIVAITTLVTTLVLAASAGVAAAEQVPPAPSPTPAPLPVSDVDRARAQAQALVTEGVGFLEADPAAALDRFQRAYAVFPSPKVLINTAAALRKLGRLPEAANVYQRFLDDPGADSARRAEVQTFLTETDAKVGLVSLAGLPVGAEVQFDGTPAPWLPPTEQAWLPPGTYTRWRVAPGAFAVRARKAGFVAAEQAGTAAAGAAVVVTFTLVEEPKAPPTSDPRVGVITPPPAGGDDELDDVEVPVEPARRGTQLGASLEVAIDGKGEGAAITPGLTLRIGSRLQVAVKALLGGSKGAYVGGTAYLMTDRKSVV